MRNNTEKETKKTPSDEEGMKWVFVAFGLGLVVMGLLIWSSLIARDANIAEAEAVARQQQENSAAGTKNYDFDLETVVCVAIYEVLLKQSATMLQWKTVMTDL